MFKQDTRNVSLVSIQLLINCSDRTRVTSYITLYVTWYVTGHITRYVTWCLARHITWHITWYVTLYVSWYSLWHMSRAMSHYMSRDMIRYNTLFNIQVRKDGDVPRVKHAIMGEGGGQDWFTARGISRTINSVHDVITLSLSHSLQRQSPPQQHHPRIIRLLLDTSNDWRHVINI